MVDRQEEAAALDVRLRDLDALGRLRALASVGKRRVFTTSLGKEDQALTHLIFANDLPIDVVTLDTGRLFEETYAVWAQTEARYGRSIRAFYPLNDELEALVARQGVNGFYGSVDARHACCDVRKVEPLRRALAGVDVWITGLRAAQSAGRGGVGFVAFDSGHNCLKANPLLDWETAALDTFIVSNDVPVNVLHGKGFPSIGCAPCTRAIAPGEKERAGRWWWENDAQKECGLHVDASGKLVRAASPALAQGPFA